jgi:hypothetical protein
VWGVTGFVTDYMLHIVEGQFTPLPLNAQKTRLFCSTTKLTKELEETSRLWSLQQVDEQHRGSRSAC